MYDIQGPPGVHEILCEKIKTKRGRMDGGLAIFRSRVKGRTVCGLLVILGDPQSKLAGGTIRVQGLMEKLCLKE